MEISTWFEGIFVLMLRNSKVEACRELLEVQLRWNLQLWSTFASFLN
jgi:hypothetical protein